MTNSNKNPSNFFRLIFLAIKFSIFLFSVRYLAKGGDHDYKFQTEKNPINTVWSSVHIHLRRKLIFKSITFLPEIWSVHARESFFFFFVLGSLSFFGPELHTIPTFCRSSDNRTITVFYAPLLSVTQEMNNPQQAVDSYGICVLDFHGDNCLR